MEKLHKGVLNHKGMWQGNRRVPLVCMRLDRTLCVDEFHKIKTAMSDVRLYYDADSESDAKKNELIRQGVKQGYAPEVVKLSPKTQARILEPLKTYRALRNILAGLAGKLHVQVFTDSRHLGPSLSLHTQYLHATHDFHDDIPQNVEPTLLTQNVHALQELRSAKNLFPLTFVLYMLDHNPSTPAGVAATSVTLEEHEPGWRRRRRLSNQQVAACEFSNCGISVFPGYQMHSVSPNPGYERITIAYKALLYSKTNVVTWPQVRDTLLTLYPSLVADVAPQIHYYQEAIDFSRKRARPDSPRPYVEF